jgi:hypothetical protein
VKDTKPHREFVPRWLVKWVKKPFEGDHWEGIEGCYEIFTGDRMRTYGSYVEVIESFYVRARTRRPIPWPYKTHDLEKLRGWISIQKKRAQVRLVPLSPLDIPRMKRYYCILCGLEVRYEHECGVLDHLKSEHDVTYPLSFVGRLEEIRCPICGEWGAERAGPGRVRCASCRKQFNVASGAFMDGVFLDKWPSISERTEKYIHEGCKQLKMGRKVEERAKELDKMLRRVESVQLTAKNPRTIVAGLLYFAGILEGRFRTQNEIAQVMKCTTISITKNYRMIERARETSLGMK